MLCFIAEQRPIRFLERNIRNSPEPSLAGSAPASGQPPLDGTGLPLFRIEAAFGGRPDFITSLFSIRNFI
jgi:hypothetical protein